MQDASKAVGVPKIGTTTITQPRNLSTATSSHHSRRLRPVLIIAALLISLPFLKGIVACGGSGTNVGETGIAGFGSGTPGSGLGMPETEITSDDYSIMQRLGNAAPIPIMESADYRLTSED